MAKFKLSDKKLNYLRKINKYSYWLLVTKSKIKDFKEKSLSKRREEKLHFMNELSRFENFIIEKFKDDAEFIELVNKIPSMKKLLIEQKKFNVETLKLKESFEIKKDSPSLERTLSIKG